MTSFTHRQHVPVAFKKSPEGFNFLQLFMAVESPFVAPLTGIMSIVVQTQSFSNAAPPGVCIFPRVQTAYDIYHDIFRSNVILCS